MKSMHQDEESTNLRKNVPWVGYFFFEMRSNLNCPLIFGDIPMPLAACLEYLFLCALIIVRWKPVWLDAAPSAF